MDVRGLERAACRALSALDARDQRRAVSVRHRLERLWIHDPHLLAIASVLPALLPDRKIFVYTRSEDGGLGELACNVDGRLSSNWDEFPRAHHLPRMAQYRLGQRDPLANRPVNTATLYRGRAEQLARFRELVLQSVGAAFQLRAALYDGARFLAYVGFLAERGQGEFGRHDGRLLTAVLPPLVDGLAATRALQAGTLGSTAFDCALDLFDEPAYLVSEHGAVVFANRAARAAGHTVPPWLGRWARDPFAEWAGRVARGRRLEIGGKPLWLVLPRALPPDHGSPLESLPPSLRRVAGPLLQGLSDKEVAASTGLSLASVRTYVTRLYRRLNVHSRAELVALLLERRGRRWS